MENNTLKRRRPFGQGQSSAAGPTLQQDHLAWFDTLPSSDREAIVRTAEVLNVPFAHLVVQRQPDTESQPKRPRLTADTSMAPLFSSSSTTQDRREKSPASRHGGPAGGPVDDPRSAPAVFSDGFSLAVAGSRLADCLVTLCPPCSPYDAQSGYNAIDAGSSYGFDASRPYPVQKMDMLSGAPSVVPDQYPPTSVAANVASFTADTPPPFGPYHHHLAEFPALEPTRDVASQSMHSLSKRADLPPAYGGVPGDEVFGRPDDGSLGRSSTEFDHVTSATSPMDHGGHFRPTLSRQSSFGMTSSPASAAAAAVAARFAMPPPGPSSAPAAMAPPDMDESHQAHEQEQHHHQHFQPPQSGRNTPTAPLQVVFPHQRAPRATRGPFKNNVDREKTARTRKLGSCIRCRMQRIRCNLDPVDEASPCISCQKISNTKVFRVPCLRLKIVDIKLFKPGQVQGFEWTKRWESNSNTSEISQWASAETKVIKVTEGYTTDAVLLKVRQFVPQEGDKLNRSWVAKGEKKSVPIPPYAIVDLAEAEKSYSRYIEKGVIECCRRVLGPKEKLIWRTYRLALLWSSEDRLPQMEKTLLTKTLYLWMSIRLSTKSCYIVGDETLGMNHDIISDEANPLHGQIPLPPVMGAQIDAVLINKIQMPARRELLETLQTVIQSNKQRTWLTTYLVTFILLHNISLITRHDASYAKKHGIKARFAREDMVREYHMGANTLLGYFHYCNKNMYPFSDYCRDQELRTLAQLDEVAIKFVKYTRNYAREHQTEWNELHRTGDAEDNYFFVSQLYEENWLPRSTI